MWLQATLSATRISLNALSQELSENGSDYRASLRGYLRQDVTVTAEKAFQIGEAIWSLRKGTWVSGPYAVAVAGYYEQLLPLLELLLPSDDDLLWDIPQLAAIHIPFLAEFELAALHQKVGAFLSGVPATHPDKMVRLLTRSIRAALMFCTRIGVMRTYLREAGMEDEHAPLNRWWAARERPRKHEVHDALGRDRGAVIAISRHAATYPLSAERLNAVILELLWQWVNLVMGDAYQYYATQIQTMRAYSTIAAQEEYESEHHENYAILAFSESDPTMKMVVRKDHTAFTLPVDERLDNLKQYASEIEKFSRGRLRLVHRMMNHDGELANEVRKYHEIFGDRIRSGKNKELNTIAPNDPIGQ